MNLSGKILWVDCIAGAVAGVTVLCLHAWIADVYRLPVRFLVSIGVANVAYGAYSFSLASRVARPLHLIQLLAIANVTWAILCIMWAFRYAQTASAFGLLHLVGEAVFVGGLGCLEWKWQRRLQVA